MEDLDLRHKLFVLEYLKDLNASQAAIRAGYSAKSARTKGYELMKNPDIKLAIESAMDKRAKRLDISADKVLQEMAKIAFSDIRSVLHWEGNSVTLVDASEIPENQARAIQEVTQRVTYDEDGNASTTFKVKMYDKMRSLEALGRHLGIFNEDKSRRPNVINITPENIGELSVIARQALMRPKNAPE
jgi:phage terminase small subunit